MYLTNGLRKKYDFVLSKPVIDSGISIYYIVGGIAAVVVAGGAAFAIYRKK